MTNLQSCPLPILDVGADGTMPLLHEVREHFKTNGPAGAIAMMIPKACGLNGSINTPATLTDGTPCNFIRAPCMDLSRNPTDSVPAILLCITTGVVGGVKVFVPEAAVRQFALLPDPLGT